MADSAAKDILDELAQLAMQRSGFEAMWQQVARVAAPEAASFEGSPIVGNSGSISLPQTPIAARRSKDIYDVTAINAVDRLASGIEALVCPQSEYWHGYGISSFTQQKPSHTEAQWLESQRNLVFQLRYDADTGFVPTIQSAIRRTIAFGNAFFMVEEGFDDTAMLRYSYLPLNECFGAENRYGIMDKFVRYYTRTARQAAQEWGDRLPAKIMKAANDPKESERPFRFVQMIAPKAEFTAGGSPFQFRSVHVAEDDRVIVGTRNFYEFPIIDFRWLPEPGQFWGEGPVMRVLAEIQSANVLAKNELLASQQAVRPPLLVANAGVMNRPNTNPDAINLGGLNPAGQEMIKPLNVGQRLDFNTMILEAKKAAIRESLYLNLFQLLVQNPQMSATEALIRANEKAELLGPAGSRFQGGLSRMVERERAILARRGLYDKGSFYATPRTLQNNWQSSFPGARRVVPQMTSPLDRIRRAKEGEGIARLLEMAAPLAQVEPEVLDNIDGDATLRQMQEILGAPVSIMRSPEARDERRAARQQAQQMAQNAAIAETLASASAQGTKALAGAKEAGVL